MYFGIFKDMYILKFITGLPHTQGNSGNFQVEENLREIQGD